MSMSPGGPQFPMPLPWLFGRSAARALARIEHNLAIIRRNQETLMSDMENLNKAISDLKTEVGEIAAEMDTLLSELQQALASGNSQAIQKATAEIQSQVDALKAAGERDKPPGSGPSP